MPSSVDEEWLLVKCDRTSDWKNNKVDQCLKTISNDQSCWAHLGSPTDDVAGAAPDYPGTALHALSMFVQQEHVGTQQRTKIEGIAFARRVVANYVKENSATHLIRGLETSHRDLCFASNDQRCSVVRALVGAAERSSWKFTAQELVPLLRRALDAGLVEDEYLKTARAICERFPASQ